MGLNRDEHLDPSQGVITAAGDGTLDVSRACAWSLCLGSCAFSVGLGGMVLAKSSQYSMLTGGGRRSAADLGAEGWVASSGR